MKRVVNFLSLRPVWTRIGLQIVWSLYLAATLINLGYNAIMIVMGNGIFSSGFPIFLLSSVLFALAHLALVRVFLELALRFLLAESEGNSGTGIRH